MVQIGLRLEEDDSGGREGEMTLTAARHQGSAMLWRASDQERGL